MSSPARRIALKIGRKNGTIKRRHKAINRFKGFPYRNCCVTKRSPEGAVLAWTRYH